MLYMGPAGTRSSRNLMLTNGAIGRPPEFGEGEDPANSGGGEASGCRVRGCGGVWGTGRIVTSASMKKHKLTPVEWLKFASEGWQFLGCFRMCPCCASAHYRCTGYRSNLNLVTIFKRVFSNTM